MMKKNQQKTTYGYKLLLSLDEVTEEVCGGCKSVFQGPQILTCIYQYRFLHHIINHSMFKWCVVSSLWSWVSYLYWQK